MIYGFDTASTLAEETRNPRQEAPKAVLGLGDRRIHHRRGLPLGRADGGPEHGGSGRRILRPAGDHRERHDLERVPTLYLLVVSAAIFVCCMSILTSTIRLGFGMARDDQLPFSKTLSKVSPRLHTPIGACVVIGVLSAVPFIQFAGAAVLAVGATAMIYLSYLLGNLAVMRARMKGWPKTKAPFSLGAWGKVVNIVALVWGAAMLVNFLTPSSASSAFDPNASGANYLRIFSNPKADPVRLLRQGTAADELPHRLREQDPRDRAVHGGRADRRRDLLLRRTTEEAVHAVDSAGRRPDRYRRGGVNDGSPGATRRGRSGRTSRWYPGPMKIVTTPRGRDLHREARRRGLGLARPPARARGFLRVARDALRAAEVEPALEVHPQLAAAAQFQAGSKAGVSWCTLTSEDWTPPPSCISTSRAGGRRPAASRPIGTEVSSSARMCRRPATPRRRRDPVSRGRDSGSDALAIRIPDRRPHDLGTDRPVEDLHLEPGPGFRELRAGRRRRRSSAPPRSRALRSSPARASDRRGARARFPARRRGRRRARA